MSLTQILKIDKVKTNTLAQFSTLLALSAILPLFHQQTVTGPLVNAILFIATIMLGVPSAMLIALIPSVIALSVGLLPAILAPAIPFIMLSNVLLVLIFNSLKNNNYWLGIISASLIKFGFLFISSHFIIKTLVQIPVAQKVSAMLSYPQLFTALIGGMLAYIILKLMKKI
ncbi:MAG: iron hydrogenase [Patescibacteria group bacterium]|jgi:hypothetical protein|nr:iron hydrogenase [Patescibacteria group bacterium]